MLLFGEKSQGCLVVPEPLFLKQDLKFRDIVKFLNFGTPEICALIYLKLKQRGKT